MSLHNMIQHCFLFVLISTSMTVQIATAGTSFHPLRQGFYESSCPKAEEIVSKAVNKAIARNPGLGAGLIRLHFHDCFVRGCDASVLIDSTPNNSAEKDSHVNAGNLRGFEVIDEAKAELEAACPRTVSCADIVAFAARDSASSLGGITYGVLSGRRDGRISRKTEATNNLPPVTSNLQQLKTSFGSKGLSLKDMVVLSGAHSIGGAHCSSFSKRLYSFSSITAQDPSLDLQFAMALKRTCPASTVTNQRVNLDLVTHHRLDNKYYVNVQSGRALFTSDQALVTSGYTASMVKLFARSNGLWADQFARAMVKMGAIQVLTGSAGEVRKNCRLVN